MIKLTTEQKVYKTIFDMIREKQEALQKTMLYHMVAHEREGHVVIPYDSDIIEKLKTDKWASTSAICVVCQIVSFRHASPSYKETHTFASLSKAKSVIQFQLNTSSE